MERRDDIMTDQDRMTISFPESSGPPPVEPETECTSNDSDIMETENDAVTAVDADDTMNDYPSERSLQGGKTVSESGGSEVGIDEEMCLERLKEIEKTKTQYLPYLGTQEHSGSQGSESSSNRDVLRDLEAQENMIANEERFKSSPSLDQNRPQGLERKHGAHHPSAIDPKTRGRILKQVQLVENAIKPLGLTTMKEDGIEKSKLSISEIPAPPPPLHPWHVSTPNAIFERLCSHYKNHCVDFKDDHVFIHKDQKCSTQCSKGPIFWWWMAYWTGVYRKIVTFRVTRVNEPTQTIPIMFCKMCGESIDQGTFTCNVLFFKVPISDRKDTYVWKDHFDNVRYQNGWYIRG